MPVVAVGKESSLLAAAQSLAARLRPGLIPDESWPPLAEQGRVLVALLETGEFAGYLVSTAWGREVRIVDLAVEPEQRGLGFARALVETLIHRSESFVGLSVLIPPDDTSRAFWPRLGFRATSKRDAESFSGGKLAFLWHDLDTTSPETQSWLHPPTPPVSVTLDAPVFFQLTAEPGDNAILQADWLRDLIRLQLPPDIKAAITKNAEPSQRIRLLQGLARYDVIPSLDYPAEAAAIVERAVSGGRPQRTSLRALVHSLVGGCSVFVTLDSALLAVSDALYNTLGAIILSPTEIISRLELLPEEVGYQPHLVNGRGYRLSERGREAEVSHEGNGVLVMTGGNAVTFSTEPPTAVSPVLAATLARPMLPNGAVQIKAPPSWLQGALHAEGFTPGKVWKRDTSKDVDLGELTGLDWTQWEKRLGRQPENSMLPVTIVPIAPSLAQATWDEALASQDLFWDAAELRSYREWVHVLNTPATWIEAPARVLWYVQPNPQYPGSGAIRAGSLLLDISVGTPEFLARKYRRFGAFSEAELVRAARGDKDGELMVLHYGWLHQLARPISLAEFGALAQSCEESPLIRAPRQLGPELAAQILARFTAHDSDE